jgi:hypothetical protein
VYIKHLIIDKLKRFEQLDLEFSRPDKTYSGLNVIVGGNSSGKSTFLRLIALALAGPEAAYRLSPNMQGWLTKGSKAGRVILTLARDVVYDKFSKRGKFPEAKLDVGLRWIADSSDATPVLRPFEERSQTGTGYSRIPAARGPWDPNSAGWFLAAYGPMRRLTGSSPDAMRFAAGGGAASRLISLFREDVALSESEDWLKNQQFKVLEKREDSTRLITQVTEFLNDGLLPNGFCIDRITSEHVYIRTGTGLTLPMRDISDGYRSIYALILDIVHSMEEVYGVDGLFEKDCRDHWIINKPGVILIDEIEAHLHPRWQRTICSWFKQRFPRIQFIVTTHSPLIVQEADQGGIYVLPMPNETGRVARRLEPHEYKRIALGRAEKVLLGEAFNLNETRGQWALRQIENWQMIKSKEAAGVALSQEEATARKGLQCEMALIAEQDL